ncbi:MAG: hypothetical protein C7B47_17660 [Sulfobacillus thermosulfidooxidans]|uniref:Uncharacterized protein n=1 Tax=Sulfobacillus thermosulfidooxidans TaxID=28034 RepID=A0A2T2WFA0_SULTH|nr:MAG: hypothetical protein C7B47_17660 [Sulfobacillus thermosulfidooxidans]
MEKSTGVTPGWIFLLQRFTPNNLKDCRKSFFACYDEYAFLLCCDQDVIFGQFGAGIMLA